MKKLFFVLCCVMSSLAAQESAKEYTTEEHNAFLVAVLTQDESALSHYYDVEKGYVCIFCHHARKLPQNFSAHLFADDQEKLQTIIPKLKLTVQEGKRKEGGACTIYLFNAFKAGRPVSVEQCGTCKKFFAQVNKHKCLGKTLEWDQVHMRETEEHAQLPEQAIKEVPSFQEFDTELEQFKLLNAGVLQTLEQMLESAQKK